MVGEGWGVLENGGMKEVMKRLGWESEWREY